MSTSFRSAAFGCAPTTFCRTSPSTRRPRVRQARKHFESALEIFRASLGEDHPNTAIVRINLASTEIFHRGDLGRAEELLTRSLSVLAVSASEKYGLGLVHLAQVELATDRTDDAEGHAHEALAVLDRVAPRAEWQVAAARSVLAKCLISRGEAEDGAAMLRRAIEVLESAEAARAREFLPAARTTLAALDA